MEHHLINSMKLCLSHTEMIPWFFPFLWLFFLVLNNLFLIPSSFPLLEKQFVLEKQYRPLLLLSQKAVYGKNQYSWYQLRTVEPCSIPTWEEHVMLPPIFTWFYHSDSYIYRKLRFQIPLTVGITKNPGVYPADSSIFLLMIHSKLTWTVSFDKLLWATFWQPQCRETLFL